MKHKVETVTEQLTDMIKTWHSVDAITLADSADIDILDPYFFLSLDVYYKGGISDPEHRRKVFVNAIAFESSQVSNKDRFLINDLPVRIEYKDMDVIDDSIKRCEAYLRVFKRTGTYMYYRLEKGHVLFQKSPWLDETRKKLSNMPEHFWKILRSSFQSTMAHCLGDLEAADMRGDNFFYLISSAFFIKSLCSLVFTINRRFEPSGRKCHDMILSLPQLPENFRGRFESILRQDDVLSPSRRREVAELLAKSLIAMK
ncbi:MAG: hypothetical protein AB1798_07655 [Spirochaetota bacterium]